MERLGAATLTGAEGRASGASESKWLPNSTGVHLPTQALQMQTLRTIASRV